MLRTTRTGGLSVLRKGFILGSALLDSDKEREGSARIVYARSVKAEVLLGAALARPYVPVDIEIPNHRLQSILEYANRSIITDASIKTWISSTCTM